MNPSTPTPPAARENDPTEARIKIYFLPNLMTAGNLFCGFVALTKIVEADLTAGDYHQIKVALGFILLGCIFDLFDGRIARIGGAESPFGREFDSLADLISFGAAPAFLVHRVVLRDVFVNYPQVGWFIASIYLLSGAFRLARFNCIAAQSGGGGGTDFRGFPIPAAAGLVASLTLLMIHIHGKEFHGGSWRYLLPVVLLFLSWMMVSNVKYPTFKKINLRATGTFAKTMVAALFIGSILILQEHILYLVLPILFTAYLVYGFVRPRISRQMRRDIEDEEEDQEDPDAPA
ncbi:MAG: CDP-diacylglycerol--serine O-phosphatidyltransferase [Verrucomicrobia bacterium]|nr:CDP-diacylglycerol--serine O-phosphatidyltransferase [Verrucomicrobiota bacterium]